MPCNNNFNQCNSFGNYPIPYFNCVRVVGSLSQNTVVNPTVDNDSFVASSVVSTQTVATNSPIIPTLNYSKGQSITYANNGVFTLTQGRYIVSYGVNGTIAGSGFSFGGFLDGTAVVNSNATNSGTTSSGGSVSNEFLITVTNPTSTFEVRNTSGETTTVTNANVNIQRID